MYKGVRMKILTTLTLSLFAFGALAQGNLAEMKRMANDSIGKQMSGLETSKSCINGAKTVDAFNACNYDMQGSTKRQKQEENIDVKKIKSVEKEMIKKTEEVPLEQENIDSGY